MGSQIQVLIRDQDYQVGVKAIVGEDKKNPEDELGQENLEVNKQAKSESRGPGGGGVSEYNLEPGKVLLPIHFLLLSLVYIEKEESQVIGFNHLDASGWAIMRF